MIKKFENKLQDHLGFSPTKDQGKAINGLARFVYAANSQVGFILRGYAGTGKTSLIGALVKTLTDFKMKSVLLAPTGRAAKVLSLHSKQAAMTIHKKIYFQNPSGGHHSYTLGKNLHTNTIFIVDEASMIASDYVGASTEIESRDLLEDLIRYTYNGKNCKILFIGDTAQLPPVGSPYSPALEKEFLDRRYYIPFGMMQLRDVVRQSEDSGILYNATKLRVLMLQEDYEIQLHTNTEDAIRVDGYTLQDDLEDAISKYGIENSIVICRSNKRANLFNQQIRHRILYHEDQINTGDLMMVLKNNYFWTEAMTDISFIANGDTIELMRITNIHDMYGFTFADVIMRLVDFPGVNEVDCKIMLDTIMTNSPALSKTQQNQLFKTIEMDYSDIRNQKKRASLVLKNPYYNALQVKFAYSVTCHKAQGGQWPVVFIDQGYLPPDGLNKEYLRWLYTALTRATEKVYFVNFSDELMEGESADTW